MKRLVLAVLLIQLCSPSFAYTTWENSPNNWNNDENNWENSSNNWKNSPNNWNNSPNNPKANIIYDGNGRPQGYAVPKRNSSGVNVYDFNGNRREYYNY